MVTVAIQRGHCFRTRGSTGTSGTYRGQRRTEQQFADTLARAMKRTLEARGHQVAVLTADEPVPPAWLFVALHQDGSSNPNVRGASVGYQTSPSARYGAIFKALYSVAGWPGGFRADNYTRAMSQYYGFRRANSTVEIIVEHGFATNHADETWMWDHIGTIARVHADTLDHYLDRPGGPTMPKYHPKTPTPTLRTGSTGPQVTKLQALLAQMAANGDVIPSPGPVDGIYGSRTATAVEALQRLLKVAADGVYGPNTAGALSRFLTFLDAIDDHPNPPATPGNPGPDDGPLSAAAVAQVRRIHRDEDSR